MEAQDLQALATGTTAEMLLTMQYTYQNSLVLLITKSGVFQKSFFLTKLM